RPSRPAGWHRVRDRPRTGGGDRAAGGAHRPSADRPHRAGCVLLWLHRSAGPAAGFQPRQAAPSAQGDGNAMSTLAISGVPVFDGEIWHEGRTLLAADGTVRGIIGSGEVPADAERVVLSGGMLVPGFVDLQVNGAGGVLFNEDRTVEGLERLCAANFQFGTTALLPTLITDTREVTREALDAGAAAHAAGVKGFAGLHIEGPHLSVARKGAHNPGYIRPMEEADLNALLEARRAMPALLTTVAVESVPPEQIARLAEGGVTVSLGHSDTKFA